MSQIMLYLDDATQALAVAFTDFPLRNDKHSRGMNRAGHPSARLVQG